MVRLPTPGGDTGLWGEILNEFLNVEHNSDGSLKSTGSLASKAEDTSVVHKSGSETVSGVKTFSASPIAPSPTTNNQVATKAYVDSIAGGESNTASNVGSGGLGLFKQKTGVNLEFKNLNAGSNKVTLTNDTANNEVDVDVNEANFSSIPQSAITNLTTALAARELIANKGVSNGYASLDSSGKVPSSQLSVSKTYPFSHTGDLSAQSGAHRLYNDSTSAWTIQSVRASVGTAPSGASVIIDVNNAGTTIFTTQSNRPSIGAGSNTSGKITTMDVTSIAAGSYLTVDIDQIGSLTPGADLTVQIEVT